MVNFAPFQIPLRRRLGQLVNIPPGFILSPITGLVIPKFQVDLVNGSRRKRIEIGFDTGMEGTHLEMPGSLARELGIAVTDQEQFVDASGLSTASVGKIDWIGISDSPSCGVRSAKVIFRENAPLLIGNDFIRDIGASIKYGSSGANLSCSGEIDSGLYMPMFRIFISNRGKIINAEALFDTGWDGADIAVPSWMAADLGLTIIGTQKARTHTGIITYTQAKADRIGLRDLGQCYVNDAIVDIHPQGSSMDSRGMVIIGEPFFKKTGGMIGYDQDGAFFGCRGAATTVRATRRERFPAESLIHEVTSDPGWIVVAAGLIAVGTLAWLVFKK